MSLAQDTRTRMVESLTDQTAGNNLIGAVGLYGGGVLNHDATVKSSAGDVIIIPDSGGAAGTYRIILTPSSLNAQIKSIDWFEVKGFTPRTPTTVETCDALVTGYNFDSVLKQWYITVQIVTLGTWAVNATPPANFVIGVRMAVTLNSTANIL